MNAVQWITAWVIRKTAASKRAEADRLWAYAEALRDRAIKLRLAANELER